MSSERTMEGLEIRLASRGAGRFFGASFLGFWLCGWAVGESIVLWLLVRGAIALITGQPPGPGRQPLPVGASLGIGAFLLLWLTLWTFGGFAAITEFLRLIAGVDVVIAHGGGLRVIHRRGPFHSTREFARDAIRRIEVTGKHRPLTVETDRGRVDLSTLGSQPEREEAAETLRRELGVTVAAPDLATALPDGWEELVTPEGERVVIQKQSIRRAQARTAAVFTLLAGGLTVLTVRNTLTDTHQFVSAIMAFALTVALAWGTLRLARGRPEWRIGSGRLTLRRRDGSQLTDQFEASRLELDLSRDSDGDEWYELRAVREGAPPPPATATVSISLGKGATPPWRRKITRAMNDDSVPRRLGAWMSKMADVPLEDRTTREARAVDLAQLTEQLQASGKFGQFAARWIVRLEQKQPPR